jgi:tetratricopeptide (TPR) repeat protein
MATSDRYSRDEVQRILSLTGKQLDYWDRLQLVSAQKEKGNRFYDFRDLIGLRTIKQLIEEGVPAGRLGRAVAALRAKLSQADTPLTELRVLYDGKDVVVERNGARIEPISGQFVLNFETRELDQQVRMMPERGADDWFAEALQTETDRTKQGEAIEAYERGLRVQPDNVEALLNCGTLYYEQANFEKAADCFRRAIQADPENALAYFNLGSVLEEVGELEEARLQLRQSVRLDPGYPDAHYNLAFVCEKLGAFPEARGHWQGYLQLDPSGPWADYARQRLAASKAKSASRS